MELNYTKNLQRQQSIYTTLKELPRTSFIDFFILFDVEAFQHTRV